MSKEPREVEGWACYKDTGYIGVTTLGPTTSYQEPVVITPKPMADQRAEALREALALCEKHRLGNWSPYATGWMNERDALIAKLRALPGMEAKDD